MPLSLNTAANTSTSSCSCLYVILRFDPVIGESHIIAVASPLPDRMCRVIRLYVVDMRPPGNHVQDELEGDTTKGDVYGVSQCSFWAWESQKEAGSRMECAWARSWGSEGDILPVSVMGTLKTPVQVGGGNNGNNDGFVRFTDEGNEVIELQPSADGCHQGLGLSTLRIRGCGD